MPDLGGGHPKCQFPHKHQLLEESTPKFIHDTKTVQLTVTLPMSMINYSLYFVGQHHLLAECRCWRVRRAPSATWCTTMTGPPLDPYPEIPHPDPKPQIPNSKPTNPKPKSQTPNPKLQTPKPQTQNLTSSPPTPNPLPSLLTPQPSSSSLLLSSLELSGAHVYAP